MGIALVFGIIFYKKIDFPVGLAPYFNLDFYNQFGPIAICIELLIAGYYLLKKNPKANFMLALFGFTAVLDPIFNLSGLFTSQVPLYATIVFVLCALVSLWLAFSNTFGLGRITLIGALMSFLLGNALELFFNYL